jgi:hypothetical protein
LFRLVEPLLSAEQYWLPRSEWTMMPVGFADRHKATSHWTRL